MNELPTAELAAVFDHTLLKADARVDQFEKLCGEARAYGFAMVAVNPFPVRLCKQLLRDTDVRVGAAIAFPLGQNTIAQKLAEARMAIEDGADEIDYVVNITALKVGDVDLLRDEMEQIVGLCRDAGVSSKAIFENCYLTCEEKVSLAGIAREVEPSYIKTSTGFGSGGATFDDVALMRETVGDRVQIKASGGVRTLDDALRYIDLGVTRIGSSNSVAIVDEYRARVEQS